MKTDRDLVAEYMAKGGKVTKLPPAAAADLEPMRPGQFRAVKDRQDMRHGRAYRGKGEV